MPDTTGGVAVSLPRRVDAVKRYRYNAKVLE
jgi:hypothetical protein